MAVTKYTAAAVQLGRHGANVRWGNETKQRVQNPGAGNIPLIAGIVGALMAGPFAGVLLGVGMAAVRENLKSQKAVPDDTRDI